MMRRGSRVAGLLYRIVLSGRRRFLAGIILCFFLLPVPGAAAGERLPYRHKKILWVDSYHESYEWSAGLGSVFRHELGGRGVELRAVHMDTKRRSSGEDIKNAVRKVRAVIASFDPDLVIASDDNAVKYVVVPYLKDTPLPVVFCGVNWDASVYGLPVSNVTGMVERDPVETQVKHLSRYARGPRIGYLSGDLFTERKITEHYNRCFFDGRMQYYPVSSLKGFEQAFLRAQDEVDMLYISNYAGIADWDAAAVEAFIVKHVRIPTGSHNPFMAPFVLVTLSKDIEEPGQWAAATALRILDGTRPADIPLAHNRVGKLTVNLRMAKALDIVFPVPILKAAHVIGQDVFTPEKAQTP